MPLRPTKRNATLRIYNSIKLINSKDGDGMNRVNPQGEVSPAEAASGHAGRRSRSERRVLDAAREILGQSGFAALTVEGVAAKSGVAKTTIYRRYRSRIDLALAVLIEGVGQVSTQPYTEETASELVKLVARTIHLMNSTLLGGIMKGLVSEVAADPDLARVYRDRVVSQRVEDVRTLVERGIAREELRAGLDPEMVTDLLLGPIYYRLFLSGSPLDEPFAKRLVATVLPAFAKTGEG